jgi:hypothetical protein
MRFLRTIQARLFMVGWVVYSGFFATNVVREHYPALALIEHGSSRCDEYFGFHDDIFRYKDGHSYINNNLLASAIAAVPLLLFKPLLLALERYSHAQLEREAAQGEQVDVHYDTKYEDRRELFRRAKLAGKDLYFGAATALTAALLMAPVNALCVALLYGFLRQRGVSERRAVGLALVFAFGTPLFYRAASLNHNTLLMAAAFGAFLCLYEQSERTYDPSLRRRISAGLLLGAVVALDYGGLVPAAVLGLYYLVVRARAVGPRAALRDALPIACGALPGLLFLFGSQWLQFGDPFLPAQFVMADAQYSGDGLRGIGAPSLEIFVKNLFSPSWGMYTYGPLLLLGLIPERGRPNAVLVVPQRERRMFALLIVSFLVFCSMNRYSLVQYNTGFRYLAVLVPFVFLQACDVLLRLRRPLSIAASALAVGHTLILCMARDATETERYLRDGARAQGVPEYQLPGYVHELFTQTPVPLAYQRIVHDGPQLPWLTVLSQTSDLGFIRGPVAPTLLMLLMLGLCAGIWWLGARAASDHDGGRGARPPDQPP